VLAHPEWQALLEVQHHAGPDRVSAGFARVQVRVIQLAVHDALEEGDKQDPRSKAQSAAVRDEFGESIGASRVLELLK
jgi:hypothetical protein